MPLLKRLVREPLLHFLLLGCLLFLLFAWQGGGTGSRRIIITSGVVDHLTTGFARAWQRPPNDIELKALIDDYVMEEIAAREAVAMGLDRDDIVIRRRLRQKLEFLLADEAGAAPPADAELKAWMERHPDALRTEPKLAFRQVYVNPSRRGASARAEAERLLTKLRATGPDAPIDRMGDASMLPPELPLGSLHEVERVYGQEFAEAVAKFEPGRWNGPVVSSFGLHLVFVRERVAGGTADLASVRPLVEREVRAERRKAELQALYDRYLANYTVTVAKPEAAPIKSAAAGGSGTK